MISPSLDGLYHYKRTVGLSIESVRSAPHRVRFAPQSRPLYSADCNGLCAIIQDQFSMEIDHALYLFCGRKCDRIKAILKEPDGIVMIYKRLTAQGSYRWPRDKSEVRNLTWREFDWLMSGIDIERK